MIQLEIRGIGPFSIATAKGKWEGRKLTCIGVTDLRAQIVEINVNDDDKREYKVGEKIQVDVEKIDAYKGTARIYGTIGFDKK